MRQLYFGGSFNPIHNGHVQCAQAVAAHAGFERVILVPSGQPPHKQGDATIAPALDRLNMCQLAAAGNPLFQVSNIEIQHKTPSYTLETARELRRRGEPKIAWLIGADMLRYLPRWHEPLALMAEVDLVIMGRPGWDFDWQTMPPEFQHLRQQVVEAPLINISATEIRRRMAANESISQLVPAPVAHYIHQHRLYRAPDSPA